MVMIALLLATRNRHKAAEIRSILGEAYRYLTLENFPDAPQVAEDAPTFEGNAVKKALALAKWLAEKPPAQIATPGARLFVLADDSGLEVDALAGAPGVHSARFAALETCGNDRIHNSSDAANNAKLLRLLKEVPLEKRRARFRCVIAVVAVESGGTTAASGEVRWFEGVCEGGIGFEPRGQNGFGYDPLFVPDGWPQTFAELGEAVKNRLSHRARALQKVAVWLATQT